MASVSPSPPVSPSSAVPPQSRHVDEQIHRTRRALKLNDFFTGMLTLVIGVLAYLLTFSVLDHWVIPGGWSDGARTVLFGLLIVGALWYCWRAFWPLISRPINPAYAAQVIERSSPTLKNSLLNFLLLRNRRQLLSEKVFEAIEQQADQRLSEAKIESVVDHTSLLRLGYVLLAMVALCAFYRILSPKNLTDSVGRILLPWAEIAVPSRVQILNVTPGNTELARGESLDVAVELEGFSEDDTAAIHYSTLDGQIEDQTSPLAGYAGGYHFKGSVPGRFGGGELGGVQQDLEYWIEAGDARSSKYQVTVFARPTLVVDKLRYDYPDYTGLPSREVRGTGDIQAIEGTKVLVYAQANHDIASANVDFEADGRNDVGMQYQGREATASFKLELAEDRRTPKHTSYVLRYKTTEGRLSTLPPRYEIDVTPDYAPEVRLIKPADESDKLIEELTVALDEEFVIEAEARDPDFALKKLTLLGKVGETDALQAELLSSEHSGKYVGHFSSTPRELQLNEGDILEYWAVAADNRQPEANTAESEHLRIRVIGKPQFDNQRGDGQQQQGEGGGAGEEGEQGEQGEGGEGQQGESTSAGGEQGEEGEQGQGGQGGEGTEGEAGEQQGAGGEGSNEGDQQGESSESQGHGNQPGEQGEDSDNPSGDPASAGGKPGEQGRQPQNEKVSAEGDDDPEAFERIADHFAEKDANSQGQAREGEAGESQETEGQPGEQGEDSDNQQGESAAQGGEQQDRTDDEAGTAGEQQSGEQQGDSQSEGTEGDPNPQQPDESQQPGEQGEAPQQGGETSPEQGDPGAGQKQGEQQGTPDAGQRKPGEKGEQKPGESQNESQEPPGQAGKEKESDSQGDQSGDKSGGGGEGAGQQADSEGTGTAGENTAADEGGGRSDQQGEGEQSNQPGESASAENEKTGNSSEDQPGQGSEQADNGAGEQPGGQQQASDDSQGESATESGEQGKESQASPSSSAGNQSGGGGDIGTQGKPTPPPPDGDVPGDEANLEFAKKKTDLVLDRLEDQLKKKDVDRDLLEKLGWTPDELQRFVDRWRNLEAAAAQPGTEGEDARAELDAALRSLGLDPDRATGFSSRTIQDKLRELKDSYRGQTPLEYADQVRAYIKGTAKAAEEE